MEMSCAMIVCMVHCLRVMVIVVVSVAVLIPMLVRVSVLMPMCRLHLEAGFSISDQHIELHSTDICPYHTGRSELVTVQWKLSKLRLQVVPVHTKV